MSIDQRNPIGIRGWLLIPAIGSVVSPAFWALAFAGSCRELLADVVWKTHAAGHSSHDSFIWSATLAFEAFGALALLVFSALILVKFFQHSRRLPGQIILFYLAVLLFTWIVAILWGIPLMADQFDLERLGAVRKDAVGATIAVLVWVPYFTFSKRVRGTFTK